MRLHPEVRRLLGDLFWMAVTAVVVTAVVYWLRQQGVDVPTLPDWVTGL
jgi:hypothetical protein